MSCHHILLVEDEFLLALRKQKELESYGYVVHHVASGEDAIELVVQEKRNFDLILMDINLDGGMFGTEAAEIILSEKDIPIVFFSSHSEPEIVQKTELITSYGYVLKNVSIVVLDASIKMAMKLFNAKNELKKIDALRTAEMELNDLRIKKQRRTIAEMVADPIIFGDNLELALNRVNEYLVQALDVARSGVWLLNEEQSELHAFSLYDAEKNSFDKGIKLETSDFPAYFSAILAENRIYCDDAQNDPRTIELKADYLEPLHITAILDAGFFFHGKLIGVVCSEHIGEKRQWHPDEESFISTVAAIVGQVFVQRMEKLHVNWMPMQLVEHGKF
jgi:CheY-like chemotaxis protein